MWMSVRVDLGCSNGSAIAIGTRAERTLAAEAEKARRWAAPKTDEVT